jgi:hypothetical protein
MSVTAAKSGSSRPEIVRNEDSGSVKTAAFGARA